MALVVEDGTGLASANSYTSVEFADAYFSMRNVTSWAVLTTEAKEVSLIKATDYIDAKNTYRFTTKQFNPEQALALPRVFLINAAYEQITGIPVLWLKAVCEYALIASTKDLFTPASAGAKEIKSKEVVVGPVKTKTEFLDTPTQGSFLSYPSADRLVIQLFGSTSGRVIR